MEIIKEMEQVEEVEYYIGFHWRDDPGAGFVFECDKDGNLLPLQPRGLENYNKCMDGTYDVVSEGFKSRVHCYLNPAVGLCSCGAEVLLERFTNTCDNCGRDYNMSGQELAPRRFWGEETGEHWSECI
jgi:hypothetical protein